jgi:hypothetical protein
LQGGGSTFGVLTSVTVKAFPSSEFAFAEITLASSVEDGDAYWDALTTMFAGFPELNDHGITAYTSIAANYPQTSDGVTTLVNGFVGYFALPLISPSQTSDSFKSLVNNFITKATAPHPQINSSVGFVTFPSFFSFYSVGNGPLTGGSDVMLGSRLLDGKALTANNTALKQAIQLATPPGQVTEMNLVGGKNVWNARPSGGSDAVNPAWRTAYVHASMFAPPNTQKTVLIIFSCGYGLDSFR